MKNCPSPTRASIDLDSKYARASAIVCGVTWDAVSEQSWLLKLRQKPAFMGIERKGHTYARSAPGRAEYRANSSGRRGAIQSAEPNPYQRRRCHGSCCRHGCLCLCRSRGSHGPSDPAPVPSRGPGSSRCSCCGRAPRGGGGTG